MDGKSLKTAGLRLRFEEYDYYVKLQEVPKLVVFL